MINRYNNKKDFNKKLGEKYYGTKPIYAGEGYLI